MKNKVIYYVGHFGGFYISLLHKAAFYPDSEAYYIYVRTYSSRPVNDFMDRLSKKSDKQFGTVICMNEELFWNLDSEEETKDRIIEYYNSLFDHINITQNSICDIYMNFDEFNSMGIYLSYESQKFNGKIVVINAALERLVSYVDMYLFNDVDERKHYSSLQRKCHTLDKQAQYVDKIIRTYEIDNINESFVKENKRRQEAIDNAKEYDYFDINEAEKNLTDAQKTSLWKIFECDALCIKDNEYNMLLLSSNFTGFKACTTMEEFICGNQILCDYCIGNQMLLLKPHPRADYGKEIWEKSFEKVTYIPSYLPAEYLELFGIKINALLSTGSTGSGYVSKIAKKRINLGRNYWWNFKLFHQIFAALNIASFIACKNIWCVNVPEEMVRELTMVYPQLSVFDSIKQVNSFDKLPENSLILFKPISPFSEEPFGKIKAELKKGVKDKNLIVVFLDVEKTYNGGIWEIPQIKNNLIEYYIKKEPIRSKIYSDVATENFYLYPTDVNLRKKLIDFDYSYTLRNTGISIHISTEWKNALQNISCVDEALLATMNNMELAFGNMQKSLNTMVNFREERLQLIDRLEPYIEELKKSDNAIFISVRDTPGHKITPALASQIKSIGISENLMSKHWYSYLAVINEHKVLYEKIDKDKALSCEMKILDNIVEMQSAALPHGNYSHIKINGMEYSINHRGLNIVVYNCKQKQLIDSVCFDSHVIGIPCYRNKLWLL